MTSFSVITPSYNQGRFLADCLRSVQLQASEVVNVEHIVVDAGSTDGTVEILQAAHGIVWTSEPDEGQTDAINKGFRQARGEWIMWLNADDYLLPGALERVADFAASRPEAAVIYGDCDFVDEQGQLLRRRRVAPFSFNLLLFDGCFIPSTSCFYHRRVLDAGFYLDAGMKVCMDYEYYLRLAHAGFAFAHLPESLAGFRWHETNISSTHGARRIAERRMLQRHYLSRRGQAWLGHELMLQLLKGWFRLLRRWRTPGASA